MRQDGARGGPDEAFCSILACPKRLNGRPESYRVSEAVALPAAWRLLQSMLEHWAGPALGSLGSIQKPFLHVTLT